jgi:uncharacterized protein (DUF1697 family)
VDSRPIYQRAFATVAVEACGDVATWGMPRHIALLRGINVGGHRVQMTALRALFEELGFDDVETFIASGNVVFDAKSRNRDALERRIESHLERALGYAVPTFIRSPAEIAAVAAYEPFPAHVVGTGFHILTVMFMADGAPDDLGARLEPFRTAMDDFHVHGRELYWLSRGRTSESLVDWARVGRAVQLPALTARNMTTVRKLAMKYGVQVR